MRQVTVTIMDDPALGDEVMGHLPQVPDHDEIDTVEFARQLSRVLFAEAEARGEKGVGILDIYMSPTIEWLGARPADDALRMWGGRDLVTEESEAHQERYRLICDRAYRSMMGRTRAGRLSTLYQAALDLYSGTTIAKRDWTPVRKRYLEAVTPVFRFAAGDRLVLLRELMATSSFEMLATMSTTTFCITGLDDDGEEERVMKLPLPLKQRLDGYLRLLPSDMESHYHDYIRHALSIIDIVTEQPAG